MKPRTVTREELYRQVWTTPMLRLAQEYGVSDVALAKVCKKMQIPRPPRGYWAKLEAGKSVRQKSLPKVSDESIQEVVIGYFSHKPKHEDLDSEARQALIIEKNLTEKIGVPENMESPHPLIKSSQKAFRAAKPDERGLLQPNIKDGIAIRVTKNSLDRALKIMDTLFKALETRNYCVKTKAGNSGTETIVTVMDEDLSIALEEKIKRVSHEKTPDEIRRLKPRSGPNFEWFSIPRFDFLPTNELTLKIESAKYTGAQQSWSDGKSRRVEDCIGSFIQGLIVAADVQKKKRLEHEARELDRQQRQQKWEGIKARYESEMERIEILDGESDAWHKAQRIRQYLHAYRQKVENSQLTDSEREAAQERIEWMQSYADHVDPLTNKSLKSIDEYNTAKSELRWY